MNRLSFTLPDVGLREIRGMVYLDEGYVVLKIQSLLFGEFDSEQELVKIEPRVLDDVWIKPGLFRDRLVIEPKRVDLLDLVPGEHRAALELRIWRKYRRDAERFLEAYDSMKRRAA